MQAYRIFQIVNAGFISAGCFTQNKPSFNQTDQACYNSGDGDRYFCGVLFHFCELVQAKSTDNKKKAYDAPKPSCDCDETFFIQA